MTKLTTVRNWTDQEKQLVREHYQGDNRGAAVVDALAVLLGRTPIAVKDRAKFMGLTQPHPRWSPEDLAFLNDNYGIMSDQEIGKRLRGRSNNALKLAARRRLNGINHKTNIYTAREVAKLFGVGCAKTIVFWYERGFLKGKRSPTHCGKTLMWDFQYRDIEKCLRRRPWLVEINRMERSFFRTIVQGEWDRNPWYTCTQAAPLLGGKDHNAVKRYIRRGWLKAERKPCGGAWQGTWIIRKSAIDAFLTDDPRREHRRQATAKSRRNTWRKFHIKRTYWAKRMATMVMVGRGVRVNRCPIDREVCHLACYFREGERCHYTGPIGRQISRSKRKKKERR